MDQGPLNDGVQPSLFLGIDTGGTYTDAVVFSDERGVIGKAKSLTTKHDLSIGIKKAAEAAFLSAQVAPGEISMVSLSTTLATNALVEGHGDSAALILIGFSDRDLEKSELRKALDSDPYILVDGGHDVHGNPRSFEPKQLDEFISVNSSRVSAFAIASMFATRNPEHEILVRNKILNDTGLPVTCSHELSSKLGGPKRALTSLLNARLIGINSRLIQSTNSFLKSHGILAPLMVVRGDGSLMTAKFAEQRPIETILSGPAASVVGAKYLTGAHDAIVSDIGGTTTDIAILEGGNPKIDPDGAKVGEYRTMVEAVAMQTFGLGGDSEINIREKNSKTGLHLGPRRAVPISLLAVDHGPSIKSTLNAQLRGERISERAGQFVFRISSENSRNAGLSSKESALYQRVSEVPVALDDVLERSADYPILRQLELRGLIRFSSFTPSDAMHVLGVSSLWDKESAELAAKIFSKRKNRFGDQISENELTLCKSVEMQMVLQSSSYILQACLADDNCVPQEDHATVIALALGKIGKTAKLSVNINKPLVGLGASAPVFYPSISKTLKVDGVQPQDCEVCNAIGAVAGNIRQKLIVEILSGDGGGSFEVFAKDGVHRFVTEQQALDFATQYLNDQLLNLALSAGALQPELNIDIVIDAPQIEGSRHFIKAKLYGVATGRPAIATVVKG